MRDPWLAHSWRLIPLTCLAYPVRLTIPETPRYTFDVEKDAEKASALLHGSPNEPAEPPKASRAEFIRHYKQWKNLKVLLGCALSWFFLVRFHPASALFDNRPLESMDRKTNKADTETKRTRMSPFTVLA